MKNIKTANDLARQIVGDGKSPNKWFVTIGYGCHKPYGDDKDMVQAKNSLESTSIVFNRKEDAEECFKGITLQTDIKNVTGHIIGQVIIEDRKTGVVAEKFLKKRENGSFYKSEYWD